MGKADFVLAAQPLLLARKCGAQAGAQGTFTSHSVQQTPPAARVWAEELQWGPTSSTHRGAALPAAPAQTTVDGWRCLQGMSHLRIEQRDSANSAAAFCTAIGTSSQKQESDGEESPQGSKSQSPHVWVRDTAMPRGSLGQLLPKDLEMRNCISCKNLSFWLWAHGAAGEECCHRIPTMSPHSND